MIEVFECRIGWSYGLMQLAGDATLMYYLIDEAQEGKQAFLEKRDPNFKQYPKFP